MRKTMSKYVDSTEHQVTEILVKNIKDSTRFYSLLGFQLLRDGGDFVEFTWEDHRLFLAEIFCIPRTSVCEFCSHIRNFLWETSG
jgi:catechol 2,3-dioxygenase-like lactoylglutathione lyase family enzyme